MINCHVAPNREDIKANKLKEPEGERIRAAFERFLKRHKIVGVMLDTGEHSIQIDIVTLPPRIKPVLTIWGSIYVRDERRPRMRSVVGHFTKDGHPFVTMSCGHCKPLPAGVYDDNTKRLCRECGK